MQRTIENFAQLNAIEQTEKLNTLDLPSIASWINTTKTMLKEINLQAEKTLARIQQLDKELRDDKLFLMAGIYVDTVTERCKSAKEYNSLTNRFNSLTDCLNLFIYYKNRLLKEQKVSAAQSNESPSIGLFKAKNNSQSISSHSSPATMARP